MEIKVLHIMRSYLPITENWLYNLLSHTVNVKHLIYSEKFLFGLFENKNFSFYTLPAEYETNAGKSIILKLKTLFTIWARHMKGNTKQRYFMNIYKKENPDIIHFHFGTMALNYQECFKYINGPIFVSFYGYDYNPKNNYKIIFNKATAFLCEGKAGKEQLIELGCPEAKIFIVPLGILVSSAFKAKSKPSRQLKLVQIASFIEKKGYMYTIKAFERVRLMCPNLTLTLIGPDSEGKKTILQYIQDNNLSKAIKVRDAVLPQNLHDELLKYDVFIHPSLTAANGDNEGGAPVVLLDAQSCGLPVISTRHKDIPSYVIHGTTGYLAEERNVHQLSEYIYLFYMMENEVYNKFSIDAKLHVLNNYNIKLNALILASLYDNLNISN